MKRLRIFLMVEAELPDETPTEMLTVELVESVIKAEAMQALDEEPSPVGRISDLMVLRLEHR